MELPTWKGAYYPHHVNSLSVRLFNHARGVMSKLGICCHICLGLGVLGGSSPEDRSYIAQDSNPSAMASDCSLIRNARTAASSCGCLESRDPSSRGCVLRKDHRLSSIKSRMSAVEKQLGCSGTPSLYEIYFM